MSETPRDSMQQLADLLRNLSVESRPSGKGTLKISKLKRGGNFSTWHAQLRVHFEMNELWGHVKDGDQVSEVKKALCKRDMMAAVDEELLMLIINHESAKAMLDTLTQLFVGTRIAKQMKLRQEFFELKFRRNWVQFMNSTQNIISQLVGCDGVLSWKEQTILFLDKLPKYINFLTHPKRVEIMSKVEVTIEDFNKCFAEILSYLIANGLYDMSANVNVKKEEEKNENLPSSNSAFSAGNKKKFKQKFRKGKGPTCWNCGKSGHIRRECPELSSTKTAANLNKNADVQRNKTNMPLEFAVFKCKTEVLKSKELLNRAELFKRGFILDTGATNHVCGEREKFVELLPLKQPEQIETANGIVMVKHTGTVKFVNDLGREVKLSNVLFWEGAPNLMSGSCITKNGNKILFEENAAVILDRTWKQLYKTKERVGGVFMMKFKPESEQFVGNVVKLWHNRLNHCSKKKLEATIADRVPVKEICREAQES